MDRNKTSLVVIVLLAGFFFIAVAMVFNTSARRNAALNKKTAVEERHLRKQIDDFLLRFLAALFQLKVFLAHAVDEFEQLEPAKIL